jgi:hypothetical protein
MMKPSASVIAAVVVAAAAIALAVSPASGASTRPDDGQGGGNRTLRFDVHFRDFTKNYVDLGAGGPTVGDLLVFQDKLFDPVSHQQVGTQGGTCTITDVQDGLHTHCVGTVALAGGQVSFQGLATDAAVKPLAVVGGTDKDRGAAGKLTLVENGDGTNTGQDDGTGTLTIELSNGHS